MVQETGWGEFEIQIKVYFQDPNERPVSMHHVLQLYPKTPYDPQNPPPYVLAECYDEFIFQEPCADMYQLLNTHPYDALARPKPSTLYSRLNSGRCANGTSRAGSTGRALS